MSPEAAADWRALGCGARLVVTDRAALAAARRAVDEVLAAVDCACSRFRADSELTALNAAAGREVEVSPLLATALAVALDAATATAGAVDPTVGAAVRLAGYDRTFDQLPPDGKALRLVARPVPGWRCVDLDRGRRRARVPPGVEVDLGATAKALAADLAAEAAHAHIGCGVLVGLGGDIALRGEPPSGGWAIEVGEDRGAEPGAGGELVVVEGGGIATSSTTVRRWRRGGAELHHLIDPRTGLPATGPWRTATVAARSCVAANTAATAAVVLGADATAWHLPSRLVDREGRVARLGGWPGR